MRRAWTFRRFALPLAGAVCWTGLTTSLTTATELLTPPQPPPDIEVYELRPSADPPPRKVVIETVDEGPVFHQPVLEPPHQVQPVLIHPADPQPLIEPPPLPTQAPPSSADILPPPLVYEGQPPPGEAIPNNAVPDEALPYFGPHGFSAPSCSSAWYDTGASDQEACYCSCVPNWTIRAEALIWDRVVGGGVPLVTAPVTLSSGDLDSTWRGGPRLTVIRHGVFGSAWDLEASYFGIDGWNGTRVVADVDTYGTTPPINIVGVTPTTLSYSSSLHNFELNARRNYSDWVQWLVGFRTLQIRESLSADFNGTASHVVETSNHLFGAQGGLDLRLIDCPTYYVNAVGKAGIYGNAADQSTTTLGVGGAVPSISVDGQQTSFIGEIGVNAGYRVTERLTLMGGYSVLWVTGVALAPEQLATTNLTTGVANLNVGETVFYHGVNLGLEYSW
jgi:hypothetical protein